MQISCKVFLTDKVTSLISHHRLRIPQKLFKEHTGVVTQTSNKGLYVPCEHPSGMSYEWLLEDSIIR
jgi:hypothetical protein